MVVFSRRIRYNSPTLVVSNGEANNLAERSVGRDVRADYETAAARRRWQTEWRMQQRARRIAAKRPLFISFHAIHMTYKGEDRRESS